MGPTFAILPDGKRLHLQHGPIDLIIGADGDRSAAFAAAEDRFSTILDELVCELPLLRSPVTATVLNPKGSAATRMDQATRFFPETDYITPMAAVAGSVADEVLAAMCQSADLHRAYVNNGGDIALFLNMGAQFAMAMAGHDGRDLGRITIKETDPIRGIATSGRHGRSLSLGIADSVTVLARNAAMADAAATMIANHVDLPDHPAVHRRPACEIVDDSDLGNLPIVTHCGPLGLSDIHQALDAGHSYAQRLIRDDHIFGASLFLQNESCMTQIQDVQCIQRDLCMA